MTSEKTIDGQDIARRTALPTKPADLDDVEAALIPSRVADGDGFFGGTAVVADLVWVVRGALVFTLVQAKVIISPIGYPIEGDVEFLSGVPPIVDVEAKIIFITFHIDGAPQDLHVRIGASVAFAFAHEAVIVILA